MALQIKIADQLFIADGFVVLTPVDESFKILTEDNRAITSEDNRALDKEH